MTTNNRTGRLAAGLAMLACVAACSLPLLVSGGIAAGVGALVTDSLVVAVVVLATSALAAAIWWRRRRDAAPGCGCDTC